MISDADCLGFDKESKYGDHVFDKESIQGIFQIIFQTLRKGIEWGGGGGDFWALFYKKNALFRKKAPFLADIERPKFLEYVVLYIANTCQ